MIDSLDRVEPPYPAHWEADVVLRDGGTAHVRPIRPDDADRLHAFHSRLSDRTVYFRFFAPYPTLTDRDVHRFTNVDHVDRVALVATVGHEIIGVVRYERIDDATAEVAFNVEDAHQGRGLGSVLLEHLAAAARERGVRQFVAEVLPENRKMLVVFQEAGYAVSRHLEEGVVSVSFGLEPTATSVEVMQAREHRAEARSIQRLLRPESVVVVGAGRRRTSLGRAVLDNLRAGGFGGRLAAVNPRATAVGDVPTYRRVSQVPWPVGLAVVAVPAAAMDATVADCAAAKVHALVVLSAGFAESGPEGVARQRRLVASAHANGMRVVGPASFGIVNPVERLNASIATVLPPAGRVGFFAQSGPLGIALLERAARRGLGLSTFVSAGNRADVSGNDLLQYWEDDTGTDVVLLHLESIGNPRKFSRLARRVAGRKPVVAVKTGRTTQGVPLGHAVRPSAAPREAVEAVFRQAGVVRVDTAEQALDVVALLQARPLPRGPRVAVVGDSAALVLLAADACHEHGLQPVGEPVTVTPDGAPAALVEAIRAACADPDVDSVVVLHAPPLGGLSPAVLDALRETDRPVVASFVATSPPERALPAYPTPDDAVRALAAATWYGQWLARPPAPPEPALGADADAARALVAQRLGERVGEGGGVVLPGPDVARLLGCYGIEVSPAVPAQDADEALRVAAALGYPVVLKARLPRLRHRPDLGGLQLGLADAGAVRSAWANITAMHPDAVGSIVVQRMAPPGVAVVVCKVEDALFGPIVSFGVGGLATELLGDRAYAGPPVTNREAAEMVRSIRAAALLRGWRGAEPVDVGAIEDLLVRVARLGDDLPEVARLELDPVLVAASGLTVLDTRVELLAPLARLDPAARRLPG